MKVKQLETEFVKSVSCGAHCTAAIAEPRENDGTIPRCRLWVWGQNQVSLDHVFSVIDVPDIYILSLTRSCHLFISRGRIFLVCFGGHLLRILYVLLLAICA